MNLLEQACHDILFKNMGYTDQALYVLYDTESPLAKILSDAYISVLGAMKLEQNQNCIIREFKNPPQPLYRGGLVNPDNPHAEKQNRIVTAHNIAENTRTGLNHHEVYQTRMALEQVSKTTPPPIVGTPQEGNFETIDPQIESIKDELISLPEGSIVVLIQSTNFRLSTFRIRLELFHLSIHVVELNHLAYILASEYTTFIDALQYRTDEYVRMEGVFARYIESATETIIESIDGSRLVYGKLERIRGNTGDYSHAKNKGGTFPIGEVFTESLDLDTVSGRCLVEAYPREDFSVEHCQPFELVIERGRVLPSSDFPPSFQKLYDWIVEFEGEVMVRELGMGINPALTTATPLSDINFYERKIGVHLSLGKKHGIYGKKLPKTEMQRFHIDVFLALEGVYIGGQRIYQDGSWSV